jgi:hypothetical protein
VALGRGGRRGWRNFGEVGGLGREGAGTGRSRGALGPVWKVGRGGGAAGDGAPRRGRGGVRLELGSSELSAGAIKRAVVLAPGGTREGRGAKIRLWRHVGVGVQRRRPWRTVADRAARGQAFLREGGGSGVL